MGVLIAYPGDLWLVEDTGVPTTNGTNLQNTITDDADPYSRIILDAQGV